MVSVSSSTGIAVEAAGLPFLDVKGEDFQRDPYGVLDRLREQSWLVRSPLGYTIIGYPEAREIKRDPDVVRIFDAVDPERSQLLYRGAAENMSSQSGARLVKLRKIVVQALRPRQVAVYREAMSAIAHMMLDRIADPQHADLVADFAGPYPGLVMSPLMGVPFSETVELDQWATNINEMGNHSRYDDRIPAIEAAWRSMESYLARLIVERRAHPRGDIVSDLTQGADADPEMTEDDLLNLAMAVVNASIDNVRAQLASTIEALLLNPVQWTAFQADLSRAPAVVEEGLRYFPAGDDIQHRLLRTKSLYGIELPANTLLFVSKKGVNRDPRLVPDPHAFRIDRESSGHMTFGFGLHACVGAILARAAIGEALLALGERVERWEVTGRYSRSGIESSARPLALPVQLDLVPHGESDHAPDS
jgi:cytochrome P450